MIGERLAELRKDFGWDQKELADKLNVTYHTISSYERNRSEPNNEMLVKIAEVFNISTDYLLGLTRTRFSYLKVIMKRLRQPLVTTIKTFNTYNVDRDYFQDN